MSIISKKKTVIITLSLVTLAIAGFSAAFYANGKEIPLIEKYPKTRFNNSYGDNTYFYVCSKEIELKRTEGNTELGTPMYLPLNSEDAKRFCRSEGVIEYRAVIDILKGKM